MLVVVKLTISQIQMVGGGIVNRKKYQMVEVSNSRFCQISRFSKICVERNSGILYVAVHFAPAAQLSHASSGDIVNYSVFVRDTATHTVRTRRETSRYFIVVSE